MKIRNLLILALALGIGSPALAGANDAVVSTWEDPEGCEYMMTTNHFELAPGEAVEFPVELIGCPAGKLGGFIYFGYRTTRNSSRALRTRDGVMLSCTDLTTGEEVSSVGGSLYLELDQGTSFMLRAENQNRKKTIKIRLRSQSSL
ncbi:MAG: hypothetical protein ACYTFE_06825 [Planctomycetota bacterium]|jgi:hypothetical protein